MTPFQQEAEAAWQKAHREDPDFYDYDEQPLYVAGYLAAKTSDTGRIGRLRWAVRQLSEEPSFAIDLILDNLQEGDLDG